MKISREKLREIINDFIGILDREKVEDLGGLEMLSGQAIPIKGKEQEYVIVEYQPSNLGTRAIDASYVIQHRPKEVGGGVPLSVKINNQLRYSKIIIKTEGKVDGFTLFFVDNFGNLIQERFFKTDYQEIKKALNELTTSLNPDRKN